MLNAAEFNEGKLEIKDGNIPEWAILPVKFQQHL